MDKEIKREIILDNYENPFKRGLKNDDTYLKINTRNHSCIDNLDIMIKIENDAIKDIVFDGEACAISISATSIMIKRLLNKTIVEALEIINNYEKMINEENYNRELMEEEIVYDEIYKQPNRKKCALLSWSGVKEILENYKN